MSTPRPSTGPAPKARAAPKGSRERRHGMVGERQAERRIRRVGQAIAVAVLGYTDRRRHDGRSARHADGLGAAVGETRQWRQRAAILRHRLGRDHRARRRPRSGTRPRSKPASIPPQEQSKLGTSLSKSRAAQRAIFAHAAERLQFDPAGHRAGARHRRHPSRSYETDQSAKLSITDTGTSFMAGQTLSTTDDKWLRKIGAEQKLFDGVTISGSIGETALRRHQQELQRRLQAQLVSMRPRPRPSRRNDPALPHIGPDAVKFGSADGDRFTSSCGGRPRSLITRNRGIADERYHSLRNN